MIILVPNVETWHADLDKEFFEFFCSYTSIGKERLGKI